MSADASFTTAGKSIAQFMKSLDGKGQFNITEGRYDGLDLDQIFRSGQVQSGTTLFDEALASYVINAGSLSNSDLLVTIPDGELRGEGTTNLGSQALDYLLTLKSLNARDGKGLAIPVRLKGPWSNLKITPDLEAALQQNLEHEIKDAEKKLTDRAKEEAAKKLGTTLEDDQSLEDALKEKAKQALQEKVEEQLKGKIEQELSNGLKNLFGGN